MEFVTEGIVLEIKKHREKDRLVNVYTKDRGRILARVVSGQRMTSKLTPHLDVLNHIQVRVVKKNSYTLTDVVTKDRFLKLRSSKEKLKQALSALYVIKKVVPVLTPDIHMWKYVLSGLNEGRLEYKIVIKMLGYDIEWASCGICEKEKAKRFAIDGHVGICEACARLFPEHAVV